MLTSKHLQFLARRLPSRVQLVFLIKLNQPSNSLPNRPFSELMLQVAVYLESLGETSQRSLQIRVSLDSVNRCSY